MGMSDEMLFTVAGSVATPAQQVSLREAGFEGRSDLEEWVLSNPEILGPGVKVVTFDFDRWPADDPNAARGDHLNVLGLGEDGRLVVAELLGGKTPESTDLNVIKQAAVASRFLPETLAEHFALFRSGRREPMTPEEALAELHLHAAELSAETLRRPRIVLIARDFSFGVTASVIWLTEMGLDITLLQLKVYLSYVLNQGVGEHVPMISVSHVYPARDVAEFAMSPERRRPEEWSEAKRRRVEDETIVRRLVGAELIADGTIFTVVTRNDLTREQRERLEEWLDDDPVRRTVHWQNKANAPLVWDADKAAYSPSALVRRMVEEATGLARDFYGTQWWRDEGGWTLVELATPSNGGKGALYREFWSRWIDKVRAEYGHWTQMSVPPAQNFVTMPSAIRGTRYGVSFAAGGRLRSELYIDYGHQEANVTQLRALQVHAQTMEAIYGRELSWEELPERVACRIADYGTGDIAKVEDHDLYIDWMIDSQERLRAAVNEVIARQAPEGIWTRR
jgi:hypothetical protein